MKIRLGISMFLGAVAVVAAEVEVVGAEAGLKEPFSMVFGPDGTMYVAEFVKGNRVVAISPDRKSFTVLAGEGGKAGKDLGDVAKGDGGPAKEGRFNGMHDLAVGPDGKLYIADTFNNRIRVLDPVAGTIDTFAGVGGKGGFGGDDGSAKKAKFNGPHTVTLSPDGKRLLVADLGNRRVREIDMARKIIRTVAGNGRRGIPRDGGTAIREPLVAPRAACYGADGKTIYIASREGNALREVTPDERITTVVNPSGGKGYEGDGAPGSMAKLNGPKHLCLGPDGGVVIVDEQNHCIRRYDPKLQRISLVAGLPEQAGKAVGTGAFDTQLNRPHGARYDAQGVLYVADSMNDRILRFAPK